MGVFSNKQIRQAIASGHIICLPFNPLHVSEASLDITLGYYYYRMDRSSDRPVYNPFDKSDIARYFEGPLKAVPHKEWCTKNGVELLDGVPDDHPIIPLRPGERILAHTHEFFGILPPGACEVKSRSTWGRNGMAVCFDAGWIDPGYVNRLTLEIYNLNQHAIMLLPVGERIAQVIFEETGEVEGSYGEGRDQGFSGKYQSGTNLQELIKQWTPDMMLPRAYLDERQLPAVVPGLKGLL